MTRDMVRVLFRETSGPNPVTLKAYALDVPGGTLWCVTGFGVTFVPTPPREILSEYVAERWSPSPPLSPLES